MKRTIATLFGAATLVLLILPDAAITAPKTSESNQTVALDVVVKGATENIGIQGSLHIVTRVSGSSVEVHTNLENTSSVGLVTGRTGHVIGSQTFSVDNALDDFGDGDVLELVQIVLMSAQNSAEQDLQSLVSKEQQQIELKLHFHAGAPTNVAVGPFSIVCPPT
jgi:hypothetical protein